MAIPLQTITLGFLAMCGSVIGQEEWTNLELGSACGIDVGRGVLGWNPDSHIYSSHLLVENTICEVSETPIGTAAVLSWVWWTVDGVVIGDSERIVL